MEALMQHKSMAQALLGGPIEDAGQLSLALVIHTLAGADGWVYKTAKELGKIGRLGRSSGYIKLAELEKMGVVERQIRPPHAVRIVREVTPQCYEATPECYEVASPTNRKGCHEVTPQCYEATPECYLADSPSPSAYLPKKIKDLKEEEEDIAASPSSSSSTERVLVTSSETPKPPCLDQPAAQPPAVAEQTDLLPAKPKVKRKRAKRKRTAMTSDWTPDEDTYAQCERQGLAREFAEGTIWEFRRFWLSNGSTMADWGGTFVNNVKRNWKKEQENEQNAEQRKRFTDASGRPISELQATTRDRNKRVLAAMESGLLDGFDLNTKV
jgi:hypothetical protein